MGSTKKTYTVSIAVFQKREFTQDQEQVCAVSLPQGAAQSSVLMGGGDLLFLNTTNVKAGQWVMLCGPNPTVGLRPQPPSMPTFKWYRVVAVDTDQGTNSLVTLAGPDWDATPARPTADPNEVCFIGNPVALYGQPATGVTSAILMHNVIGVYTETIEVDN
jgi:hypothetical protein